MDLAYHHLMGHLRHAGLWGVVLGVIMAGAAVFGAPMGVAIVGRVIAGVLAVVFTGGGVVEMVDRHGFEKSIKLKASQIAYPGPEPTRLTKIGGQSIAVLGREGLFAPQEMTEVDNEPVERGRDRVGRE